MILLPDMASPETEAYPAIIEAKYVALLAQALQSTDSNKLRSTIHILNQIQY